jgi:translocation and assembly module TamB
LENNLLFNIQGSGQAHFGGSTNHPVCDGKITVNRGTITYLSNDFNINQGQATFIHNRTFIPDINLVAQARVSTSNPANQSLSKIVTITMRITDPDGKLDIKFSSDSGLSDTDIVSLLTFGQVFDANNTFNGQNSQVGTNQMNNLLNAGLQMTALGGIESTLRSNFGIDSIRLQRAIAISSMGNDNTNLNVNADPVYNLLVGKYLTDRFMLKSTVGLGYNYYQFQAQYEILKNLLLMASIDSQYNNSITINRSWSF